MQLPPQKSKNSKKKLLDWKISQSADTADTAVDDVNDDADDAIHDNFAPTKAPKMPKEPREKKPRSDPNKHPYHAYVPPMIYQAPKDHVVHAGKTTTR